MQVTQSQAINKIVLEIPATEYNMMVEMGKLINLTPEGLIAHGLDLILKHIKDTQTQNIGPTNEAQ